MHSTEDVGQSTYTLQLGQQVCMADIKIAEAGQDLAGSLGLLSSLIQKGHRQWQRPCRETRVVVTRLPSEKGRQLDVMCVLTRIYTRPMTLCNANREKQAQQTSTCMGIISEQGVEAG